MERLPFTVYDFFAYLSSGFVVLIGIAAAFTNSDTWQDSPTAIVGLLLVVLAYVVGHVVATVSAYLFEAVLVGRILGTPSVNLFKEAPATKWAGVFPGYFKALPPEQRRRVLEKARGEGIDQPGQGLFFQAWARVKERQAVMERLSTFLNVYGFCRNMAMALLVTGGALTVGSIIGTARTGDLVPPGWWAGAALAGSVAMIYRYLKFFRHYGVEVFLSYAERD
jgi:hypothetical protein